MEGNLITRNDLDRIHHEISTKCAFYTDQVQFGVEMTLDAVLELILSRSKKMKVIGLSTVNET